MLEKTFLFFSFLLELKRIKRGLYYMITTIPSFVRSHILSFLSLEDRLSFAASNQEANREGRSYWQKICKANNFNWKPERLDCWVMMFIEALHSELVTWVRGCTYLRGMPELWGESAYRQPIFGEPAWVITTGTLSDFLGPSSASESLDLRVDLDHNKIYMKRKRSEV